MTQIVHALLSAGFKAIDSPYMNPIPWENQSVDYVLNRISSEWDQLGRDPNPVECVWFDNSGIRDIKPPK